MVLHKMTNVVDLREPHTNKKQKTKIRLSINKFKKNHSQKKYMDDTIIIPGSYRVAPKRQDKVFVELTRNLLSDDFLYDMTICDKDGNRLQNSFLRSTTSYKSKINPNGLLLNSIISIRLGDIILFTYTSGRFRETKHYVAYRITSVEKQDIPYTSCGNTESNGSLERKPTAVDVGVVLKKMISFSTNTLVPNPVENEYGTQEDFDIITKSYNEIVRLYDTSGENNVSRLLSGLRPPTTYVSRTTDIEVTPNIDNTTLHTSDACSTYTLYQFVGKLKQLYTDMISKSKSRVFPRLGIFIHATKDCVVADVYHINKAKDTFTNRIKDTATNTIVWYINDSENVIDYLSDSVPSDMVQQLEDGMVISFSGNYLL